MKKNNKYQVHLYIMAALFLLTACEKELEVYDTETCRLNFHYSSSTYREADAHSSYSFVYGGSLLKQDTVWLEVKAMGYVKDYDRPISLEQVNICTGDSMEAVAGKHFVNFEDASLKSYYVIKAGETTATVPVILLRDASLEEQGDAYLGIHIKPNSEFENGYEKYQTHYITISDQLAEPSAWRSNYLHYYLASWSRVLHTWLIDHTGNAWDNDYINSINEDSGYFTYILKKVVKDFNEYVAEHGNVIDENGQVIRLNRYGYL